MRVVDSEWHLELESAWPTKFVFESLCVSWGQQQLLASTFYCICVSVSNSINVWMCIGSFGTLCPHVRHYSTFNAPFFFSQYLSHDISYTHLNIKFGLKTQSKNDQKVWFLPSTPFWPINKRRTKTCDIQFLLMVRFL